MKNLLTEVRKWLIIRLVGKMPVLMNCSVQGYIRNPNPFCKKPVICMFNHVDGVHDKTAVVLGI